MGKEEYKKVIEGLKKHLKPRPNDGILGRIITNGTITATSGTTLDINLMNQYIRDINDLSTTTSQGSWVIYTGSTGVDNYNQAMRNLIYNNQTSSLTSNTNN